MMCNLENGHRTLKLLFRSFNLLFVLLNLLSIAFRRTRLLISFTFASHFYKNLISGSKSLYAFIPTDDQLKPISKNGGKWFACWNAIRQWRNVWRRVRFVAGLDFFRWIGLSVRSANGAIYCSMVMLYYSDLLQKLFVFSPEPIKESSCGYQDILIKTNTKN